MRKDPNNTNTLDTLREENARLREENTHLRERLAALEAQSHKAQTEDQQERENLESKVRFFEKVTQSSVHIIFLADLLTPGMRYISRHPGLDLGYSEEEIAQMGPFIFRSVAHPDDRDKIDAMTRDWKQPDQNTPVSIEIRMQHTNGSWRWFLVHVSAFSYTDDKRPKEVLGSLYDITEHKNLEEQLHQSSKLESIGRLAGGIAHDFNNILTSILAFADLAQSDLDASHPVYPQLEYILESTEQGASLTQQLLGFARKQVIHPQVIELNDSVQRKVPLLRRMLSNEIHISITQHPTPLPIKIDPSQLDQLLMNLSANARDAMPEGGTIHIETTLHTVLPDEPHSPLPNGNYAVLSFRDDGTGMDDEVQRHIFEPFYTTKELGKGTGLGLATCYGIIKQNNGHIFLESSPSQGSTFHIYLPLQNGPPQNSQTPSSEHQTT